MNYADDQYGRYGQHDDAGLGVPLRVREAGHLGCWSRRVSVQVRGSTPPDCGPHGPITKLPPTATTHSARPTARPSATVSAPRQSRAFAPGRRTSSRPGSLVAVQAMQFEATAVEVGRGRAIVPVPFDPDQVWGAKPRHHVTGVVNGVPVRAEIEAVGDGLGFVLGPAWRRDCGIGAGDQVQVQISPEGPQRADLPADLAAALQANPAAGQFFDSLAQFYRKGYLRWINATRRRPQLRAERIAAVVQLLADHQKTRPRSGCEE
jgi:hypothetical protein